MRLVYWAVSLLLVALLSLQTVPQVMRDLIVYTLLQQGAETATLERVDIDWLNAKLDLHQLEVSHEQQQMLAIKHLSFDIYLRELLDKRVRLSGLRLEGVSAQIQQEGQLLLLGPIVLLGGEASEAQAEPLDTDYEFGSDLIELVDVNLELLQATGPQQLNIERLRVGGLYQWSPFEATEVRFVGRLNGAPMTIDSSALPLPERKTVSINIALRELDITPLLGAMETDLSAALEANLNVEIALQGYSASVSQSGSLGLNDLRVSTADGRLQFESLRWQGDAQQQFDLSEGAEFLEQLSINGVLNMNAVSASHSLGELEVSGVELRPQLSFMPAGQKLEGGVALALTQLHARSQFGEAEVASLDLKAPMIQPGDALKLDLALSGVSVLSANGESLSLQQLAATTELAAISGAPVWQPESATLELSADVAKVDLDSLQASFEKLHLVGRSSSLTQLAKVNADVETQGLKVTTPGLSSDLNGLRVALAYEPEDAVNGTIDLEVLAPQVVAQGEAINGSLGPLQLNGRYGLSSGKTNLQLNIGEVDLKTPELGVRSSNSNIELDGQLGAALDKFVGQVQLGSAKFGLSQSGQRVAWDSLTFTGPVELPLAAQLAQLPFALQGKLNLAGVMVELPQQADLQLGALSGDLDLKQQETLSLATTADLNELTLQMPAQTLALAKGRLDTRLNFSQRLDKLDPQAVTGTLGAALQQLSVKREGQTISLAGLDTALKLDGLTAEQRLQGSIGSQGVRLESEQLSAEVDALELKPEVQVSAAGVRLATPVQLSGVSYKDPQQSAALTSVTTNLSVQLNGNMELERAELGGVSVKDLGLSVAEQVSVAELSAAAISLTGQQQLSVKQLGVSGLLLGSQESPMVQLNRLELDQADFQDNYLQLGRLATDNLQVSLQSQLKAASGQAVAAKSSGPTDAPTAGEAADKHLPIDVSLQEYQARGDTRIIYRDSTLAAPLNLNLVTSQLSIGKWDSRSGDLLPLKFKGTINESTDVVLTANITPLKTKPTGDWSLQLQSLPLPLLSPLIESFAGYQVRSGALTLDSQGTIKEGQLKGNNSVRVQRLEVQRGSADAANATDKLFTMPLPSAVSLLEREDRVIKLDLPVSGDISDPKFNYQDVLQVVITKAVKQGATTYLTNSLQPFGAIYMLYSAVKDVNESGRFIQLQPLEYDISSGELNQTGRDYAAKLGGMMLDRPGLTLEICPVTLVTEEKVLWDQLVDAQKSSKSPLTGTALGDEWNQQIAGLAAARVEALRSTLVRLGIDRERIFQCIARSGQTEGAPRVELAF